MEDKKVHISKRFALIGGAGYIAPRHYKAICDLGHKLVAVYDISDSMGVLDQYAPTAYFFTSFERFDRFLDKQRRFGLPVTHLVVCSPNHLHDAHIRFGLRQGMEVICEKPIVVDSKNLEGLLLLQSKSGKKVHPILQLRKHPSVIAWKNEITSAANKPSQTVIDLTYITPRGNWYYASWKGIQEKSGGLATNIGIHFFDMLLWALGPVLDFQVHVRSHDRETGLIQFSNARVRYFLSIDGATVPQAQGKSATGSYRSLRVDNHEVTFSDGFMDLHTEVYKDILDNKGCSLADAQPAIELLTKMRAVTPSLPNDPEEAHPLIRSQQKKHPFSA
ncbi:MAG: gfo/Idh/MocA family oxidoreductase [Bacteroidetes bacterium]|nr:MAG: gfo/Idh/MocA family oxidoreductase [Bacteroidota bacterium]